VRSKSPIPVLFNHGMTLFHTPSEMDSIAIGVVEEIKADKRGLFTRARYHDTPRAHEVLEAIRSRAITSYSFSGVFKKSTPNVPRGGFRKANDGTLPVVRRMESTLRELGPAQFAVYEGAEVVGIRAEQIARSMFNMDPEERRRLAALISGTPLDSPEIDTSLEGEPATEDPLDEHSVRTPKQILLANYANFLRRSA
jgi:phage head maturation protease